jgi:hypothetical protein
LRLALAGRAQQPHPLGDQFGLEPAAVVVLIRKSTVSRHAAASGRSPDPIGVAPVAR